MKPTLYHRLTSVFLSRTSPYATRPRPSHAAKHMTLRIESLEDRCVPTGGLVGNLVVFGDSLADVGNVALATGGQIPTPNVYAPGRFSGGPVWAETLAEYLGEEGLRPSVLGGTDYAFGGATVAASGLPPLDQVPNLKQQVGQYLTGLGLPGGVAHQPAANDLFAVWAGANDFFYTFASPTGPIDPRITAAGVVQALESLAQNGARQFVVNNLPPLGQTPFFTDLGIPPLKTGADQWTAGFNAALDAGLDAFRTAHPGVKVIEVDTAKLFAKATSPANPYGFSNLTSAVGEYVAPGESVLIKNVKAADPARYLFFDGIHPGAKTHQIIGLEAAQQTYSALGVHSITVTTTADEINPLSNSLSFREAINLANALPGRDTIKFALGGGIRQITLTSPVSFTDDVDVHGSGTKSLIISGGGKSRILDVAAGVNASVSQVTLTGGQAEKGGAVNNAGSLLLCAMQLTKNSATIGGAVYNAGSLHVQDSQFDRNSATTGGAIANSGQDANAWLVNMSILDNQAKGTLAQGGGIANLGGSLTVAASRIARNQAEGRDAQGGGIYNAANSSMALILSLVTGNTAISTQSPGRGLGGGLFLADNSRVSLLLSLVVGNVASTRGSNIYRA